MWDVLCYLRIFYESLFEMVEACSRNRRHSCSSGSTANPGGCDADWVLVFFHYVTKVFVTKLQIIASRLANVHDALKENAL